MRIKCVRDIDPGGDTIYVEKKNNVVGSGKLHLFRGKDHRERNQSIWFQGHSEMTKTRFNMASVRQSQIVISLS